MKTSQDQIDNQIDTQTSVSQQAESGSMDNTFSQTLSELIVEKKDRQANILLDQLTSWLHGKK